MSINLRNHRLALRFLVATGGIVLLAIAGVNILAWNHADAMMTFTSSGQKTAKPENLNFQEKLNILLFGVNVPKPRNLQNPTHYGLPFETHKLTNPSGHSLEGWYIPKPRSNNVILLFHGYASSKASLLPIAQELHLHGYATFLIDFYGSGGSSGSTTTIGIKEAEDVALTTHYIQERLPDHKIVLYGVSMGGAAILRSIATHNIKPSAIIIESTFDRLLTTTQNRFHSMNLPSFPLAELLIFWGGVQQGVNPFTHNPAEYAAFVSCPSLVLHGAMDQRVSIEEANHIFHNLPATKQFQLYEGVGHQLLADAAKEKWTSDVLKFLSKI